MVIIRVDAYILPLVIIKVLSVANYHHLVSQFDWGN
jgi:hypothetical protein